MAEPIAGALDPVPGPPPAPEEAAPETPPEAVETPPADPDQQLDAETDESALDLQDGSEKLVPLGAVTRYRERVKALKKELAEKGTGADRAAELETQIQQLQQNLNQVLPAAQAYQAILQSQQQAPAEQPRDDTPQVSDADALAMAQDLDLYDKNGRPDLDRGRKVVARQLAAAHMAARQAAEEAVQPLQQQSVSQQAEQFRAMWRNTRDAEGNPLVDPQMFDSVWQRAATDPRAVATKEGAFWAAAAAIGAQELRRRAAAQAQPKKAAEPKAPVDAPPDPIYTERSGGRGDVATQITEADRRFMRDSGITEKEWKEQLKDMPDNWGKGA